MTVVKFPGSSEEDLFRCIEFQGEIAHLRRPENGRKLSGSRSAFPGVGRVLREPVASATTNTSFQVHVSKE